MIGSGVGLALGAGYLSAGLGQVALQRAETVRLALGPNAGFGEMAATGAGLRGPQGLPAGAEPNAVSMAVAKPTRARELDCLTQAVYFEARGESPRGQQAVATVIMNRVKNKNFPKTVCAVVYQGSTHHNGCQFSFACDGRAERVVERNAWDRARSVAARALSGAVLRDIGSATHFHTIDVDPDWGSQMLRVAQVGLHVFYRFNPHAPRPVQADDDGAVFVSAPAPANPQMQVAQAMPAPAPVADAAKPAAAADAKPVAKLPDVPPAGLSKTDTPTQPKLQAATPS